LWYFITFVLGAIIGSFLNTVIYRLSVEGLTLWDPPYSVCPVCKHRLSWKDNIPLISYIILSGKCRYCGSKIPVRYFIVEFFNASFYLVTSMLVKNILSLVSLWGIFSSLLAISFMDIETYSIHDGLLIILLISSLLFSCSIHNLLYGSISALVGFIFFFTLYKLKKGIGFGDVLLIGAAGFSMDLIRLNIAILIAAASGIVYSLIAFKGYKPKKTIPFTPFMSVGIITSIFLMLLQ